MMRSYDSFGPKATGVDAKPAPEVPRR